jgi:RNA polymerase sigma factor (sigma-70 family)
LRNWLLTQDAFDGLLAHFDEDRGRAAEEYELTRAALVRLFRYRGCNSPHELADETIDRVARKLAEGTIVPRQELVNYFYGVARNVLREYLRDPETGSQSTDELAPAHHPAEDPEESRRFSSERVIFERRLLCLEGCLEQLPPETRTLIVTYYEGKEGAKIKNRQRLARELEVSLNSLRIRVHRLREQLETCVSTCMRQGAPG